MTEEEKKKQEEEAAANNQPASKRNWRDILSSRNAELDLEDEDAVSQYLDDSFNQYDQLNNERTKLNDVLSSDPRAAGLLTGLASGQGEDGEPFYLVGYIIDEYWDEIQEAASADEAKEKVRAKEEAKLQETQNAEKRRSEAEANLAHTDEELTKAVQATNIDDANAANMLDWLYGKEESPGFIHRIITHQLEQSDWETLIHAFNKDAEIDAARKQGRSEARNQRSAMHRRMDEAPTDLGGGTSKDAGAAKNDHTLARLKAMSRKF